MISIISIDHFFRPFFKHPKNLDDKPIREFFLEDLMNCPKCPKVQKCEYFLTLLDVAARFLQQTLPLFLT